MDVARFDALARSVGSRGSRRGFVAGLFGIGAGITGLRTADAACPPGQVRAARGCVCRTTGRPPLGGDCPCPSGQERCGETCVSPSAFRNDPANCGACEVACPAEAPVCHRGTCCTPASVCPDEACGAVDDGCGGVLGCGPCPLACAGDSCLGEGQSTCCAGAECVDFVCCIPYRDIQIPNPAACVTTAECCQNGPGSIACQADGVCCAPLDAACNGDAECCSGACDLNARVCVTCYGAGVPCTNNPGACCAGLTCAGIPGCQPVD